MRAMIELQGHEDVAVADDMLARVRAAGSPAPILLHGLDESCWPLLEHAGVVGVQTRIGLEDTLALPDGSIAPESLADIIDRTEVRRPPEPAPDDAHALTGRPHGDRPGHDAAPEHNGAHTNGASRRDAVEESNR